MPDGPDANARGEYDHSYAVQTLEGKVEYLRGFCQSLLERIEVIEKHLRERHLGGF